MEKAVVVGNCQALALEIMLTTSEQFSKRFEFVSFPAVHEIPESVVPLLHNAVAESTLVILQRVAEDYRGGLGLGTETLARLAKGANVVRWPSIYWAGYFPDLFYLRDSYGRPVVDGPFDYHDRVILDSYGAGLDVETTRIILEDAERPSPALAVAAAATAELDLRDRDCDVHVTSFISERYRGKLLFFTMNHPTNLLMAFISQQVMDIVGLPGHVDDRRIPDELLGSTLYPFHANHIRALGLEFGTEVGAGFTPFRIRGLALEPSRAIRSFFDYYEAHPQLVELNMSQG